MTDETPETGKAAKVAHTATRRATIADVAREAGVSISAVSKVVRGAAGVSAQMDAKVTAAITKLGYRPHAGARAMRGRSFTIGVSLGELSSPFQAEVAESIGAALLETPYQEIIVSSAPDVLHRERTVEALLDRQIDGLVMVAPWVDADWLEELAARVPTVAVGLHGEPSSMDIVTSDDATGASLAVNHLVGFGHRRIAHTSMPAGPVAPVYAMSHTERQRGYAEAMTRHGLVPDVIETTYSERGGYEAAAQLLDAPERPTAIFAGADIAAFGVIRAARERGLRVPEDLSVIGYDNIAAAGMVGVELTTVSQSSSHTGFEAAEALLGRLDKGTSPAKRLLHPELVVRATVARAAI